jgi:hypothetical protein
MESARISEDFLIIEDQPDGAALIPILQSLNNEPKYQVQRKHQALHVWLSCYISLRLWTLSLFNMRKIKPFFA